MRLPLPKEQAQEKAGDLGHLISSWSLICTLDSQAFVRLPALKTAREVPHGRKGQKASAPTLRRGELPFREGFHKGNLSMPQEPPQVQPTLSHRTAVMILHDCCSRCFK